MVLAPCRPARAVVAGEAPDWLTTHVLPVLVVASSAVIAGYPVGRWAARRERREAQCDHGPPATVVRSRDDGSDAQP
ncbi:MAG TPA: hypothetical protein VI248_27595 [Kineosporiaceae bacterium]